MKTKLHLPSKHLYDTETHKSEQDTIAALLKRANMAESDLITAVHLLGIVVNGYSLLLDYEDLELCVEFIGRFKKEKSQ